MPGIPDIDIGFASDHPSIRDVARLAASSLLRCRDIFSIGDRTVTTTSFARNWLRDGTAT
jgi:hypothetical protein